MFLSGKLNRIVVEINFPATQLDAGRAFLQLMGALITCMKITIMVNLEGLKGCQAVVHVQPGFVRHKASGGYGSGAKGKL